jgi:hypothetical protein
MRGEMIDDETDTDAMDEIVPNSSLLWTFPFPVRSPPINIPDMIPSEGESVMSYSHRSLHMPPPPLRFVLESNSEHRQLH